MILTIIDGSADASGELGAYRIAEGPRSTTSFQNRYPDGHAVDVVVREIIAGRFSLFLGEPGEAGRSAPQRSVG
jgi:hypothetical protein